VRFLAVPHAAAAAYGVPAKEGGDTAYLTIKGFARLQLRHPRHRPARLRGRPRRGLVHAGRYPCPLGDTAIVLRHGGTKAAAFGIHFATAMVMLVDAALLFTI
jgi:hypothetical protein